jgi:hypothetical protein
MTDPHARTQAAFRLNLEQQKKRAKEILKAARAGDPGAMSRFASLRPLPDPSTDELQLADAQRLIARDLGFASWAELKAHVAALDRARNAVANANLAPDRDRSTLHLRCGSDIRQTLLTAGFKGDFLEHSFPYAHGPISTHADHYEREARFIVEFADPHLNLSFEQVLERRLKEERELAASAQRYERIVLWMEHDCFDQLVLARCLAHYATLDELPVLDLVQTDRFPGTLRFIGLGQLPEEGLRLLWERRQPVSRAALDYASSIWKAVSLDDPCPLTALMRRPCADLPYLAPAIRRLLQELPSVRSGLSFTERLILEALAATDQPMTVSQLFGVLTYERDPLPFATDFFLHTTIERLANVATPLVARNRTENKWHDPVTLTQAGRQALNAELDFLALEPQPRWVGGVEIHPGSTVWRWDEERGGVRA